MMTKLEMLLVRACKSHNPEKRIYSVYRRFYYSGQISNPARDAAISSILVDISDKYCPISTRELIDGLHPDSIFNMSPKDSYYDLTKAVLTSHIRLQHKDKFTGMISPIVFRK